MTDGADCCDIDTLTAFLGESDEDIQDVKHKGNDDQCDMDEIAAFLEESDEEDNQDFAETDLNDDIDNPEGSLNRSNMYKEHQELNKTSSTGKHLYPETSNEREAHCNNSEEKQSSVNDDHNIDDSQAAVNSVPDESEALVSEEMIAHDAIKAEMLAMAERMKKLQDLLEKTTPKSKAKSSSSSKTENKVINNYKETPRQTSNQPSNSKLSVSKPIDNPRLKPTLCDIKNDKSSVSPAASKTFMTAAKTTIPSTSPKIKDNKQVGIVQANHRHNLLEDDVNPFFKEAEDVEVKVDSTTLFGDSDDSDWEDLAGDEKTKLSGEGKEMKKLLNQGAKKREAHTPNYDPALLKKQSLSTWKGESSKPPSKTQSSHHVELEKPKLNPYTGTVSGKYKVKEEYMPKVALSSQEDNRQFVQDPYCGIRIVNPRISMDSFKTKMDGRTLIKISRLLSKLGATDLQKDNWVTLGVVVHKTEPRQSANGKTYCIWKLSDLVNCDQTVSFFLFGNVYKEHWKNKEGVVIGLLNPSTMDKAEKAQSEIALTINHPQQLLIMGVSKDLGRCKGTTKAGTVCSNFINRNQGEYCTYHVQAAYRKSSSKRTELQASTGRAPQAFEQKKRAGPNSTAGCFFYAGQTFTSMTPRTANTKDKVTLKKLNILEAGKEQGKLTTMSLHDFKPEDRQKLDKIKEKDKQLLELLAVPTVGSMNFVKHLVKKDKIEKQTDSDQPDVHIEVSAKDLLKQHSSTLKQKHMVKKTDPLNACPKLGKGFQTGQEISLDVPIKKGNQTAASAELAKKLAIAKVKSKGGLTKEDPNAVRKKITSPENRDKIRKRVADDIETGTNDNETAKEPPRKKSKLLGNLDLNSDEVQKLIKVKSKHKGALAEAESEHEDRYFSSLEKKERMEEKMDSIKEQSVTLFVCKQCNYRYYSLHDRCKQENHSVKRISGIKRFFKCKQCKKRCTSLDKMPTKPCKECGSSSFERVSMLMEKTGPKLESEQLSIRGNEQKYVGSIHGKAFLNV